jgi:hypothetical protein
MNTIADEVFLELGLWEELLQFLLKGECIFQ